MKLPTLLSVLPLARAFTAQIAIQPIHPSNPAPAVLAELSYTLEATTSPTDQTAEITLYEPPLFPDGLASDPSFSLVRIGAFDPSKQDFGSATTVARVSNFQKGYAPVFMVMADPATGGIISASVRGAKIDAGYTRDFGPRVEVRVPAQGKQPELNKPVVLSPDGRKIPVEQEKTLLQKYWWLLAVVVFVAVTAGGGDGK